MSTFVFHRLYYVQAHLTNRVHNPAIHFLTLRHAVTDEKEGVEFSDDAQVTVFVAGKLLKFNINDITSGDIIVKPESCDFIDYIF